MAPSPPRFSYLPIPTIGHEHADGRIRRFIIAEPYGSTDDGVRWARQTLNLKTLIDEDGEEKARLSYMRSDKVLDCYTRESNVFETVTPVVLTGHDDRNYKKTQRMLLRAIEQAGFSQGDIESIYLQKAPFFPGGVSSARLRVASLLEGDASFGHSRPNCLETTTLRPACHRCR